MNTTTPETPMPIPAPVLFDVLNDLHLPVRIHEGETLIVSDLHPANPRVTLDRYAGVPILRGGPAQVRPLIARLLAGGVIRRCDDGRDVAPLRRLTAADRRREYVLGHAVDVPRVAPAAIVQAMVDAGYAARSVREDLRVLLADGRLVRDGDDVRITARGVAFCEHVADLDDDDEMCVGG